MGQSYSGHVVDDKTPKIFVPVQSTMRERLECKKSQLYIDALNDECIPIVCAVDKFEDIIYIEKLTDALSRVKDDIKSILRRHLRSSDNTSDGFDGLIELLEEVLKTMLKSDGKPATFEERQIHVVQANKSFIRIDYYLYFQTDGKEAALFYYVQVGLIEVAKTRLPVLIYELTRATKDDKLEEASKELERVGELKISSVRDAVEYLKGRAERRSQQTQQQRQTGASPVSSSTT